MYFLVDVLDKRFRNTRVTFRNNRFIRLLEILLWLLLEILVFSRNLFSITPSIPKRMMFYDCIKSNFLNFDKNYRKNYIYLWYEINIIRLIMRSIFIIYLFDVLSIDTFLYKFGHSYFLHQNLVEVYKVWLRTIIKRRSFWTWGVY
jgi:hypothetical protein